MLAGLLVVTLVLALFAWREDHSRLTARFEAALADARRQREEAEGRAADALKRAAEAEPTYERADAARREARLLDDRLAGQISKVKQQNYRLRLMLEQAITRESLLPSEAERVLANAREILGEQRPEV